MSDVRPGPLVPDGRPDPVSPPATRAERRVLRQMDRAARSAGRRSGPSLVPPALRTVLSLAVLAGLVAAGSVVLDVGPLRPRTWVEVDGRSFVVPDPLPAQGRLRPAVVPTTEGSHAFLHLDDDGAPVGYDPCRPVRWVQRPDGAPQVGEALVADAVASVAAASGLSFEYVGLTDEAPAAQRELVQPDRYGEGWAPLLVAWADAVEMPELAGEVAGVGGSAAVPGADGSGTWLVGGRVVLDSDDLTAMLAREDGYAQARAIVMHELAHAIGLDHVADTRELMHPQTAARTTFGSGDLQGLALVGASACE